MAGVEDQPTTEVRAEAVDAIERGTLQGFVLRNTQTDVMVYTDEYGAYIGLNRPHKKVNHSTGEYVRDTAHTNWMESFWVLLKRGYHGIYHQTSKKHLQRYVNKLPATTTTGSTNTVDQMGRIVRSMIGKRLRYADLAGPVETRNPKIL